MREACPALAHQIAEIAVALALVQERIDSISQPLQVVEDERHFLEMRDLDGPGDTGRDGIEAITVCGQICSSPGLAGQSACCYEYLVAEVSGAAAVLCSIGCSEYDITT